MPDTTALPHCPECGYTAEDAAMWLDHHLCKGQIPKSCASGLCGDAHAEHRSGEQPAGGSPELYYIQNKGYCGNCLLFWCEDGHGYTLNLDKAWKVTKEKAESICRSRPHEDIPLPASLLDRIAGRHVSCETLWQAQRDVSEKEATHAL